jgi:hypothetical protein
VVSVEQDLFWMWCGESQTGPVRAYVRVHDVRDGPGPGRERRTEPLSNLAVLGEAMVAGSGPETINGRGGEGVLALPVKRQPGTAQADNTGTALPQGRTAVSELTNAH